MRIISSPEEMQRYCLKKKSQGKTISLVPTMGNLHDGHISLVNYAAKQADILVVSIYVNPTQFGPQEDFENYPRTFEEDSAKLSTLNVDVIFAPDKKDLYPYGNEKYTHIKCPSLDIMLCSYTRPHFFTGVATVVTKLINIVQPDIAVFGEKDYQQLLIVRRVCKELFIPVTITAQPTVRDPSGLALSSRNSYLNEEEMKIASKLYETLLKAKKDILDKPHKIEDKNYISSLQEHAKIALTEFGFKIDYFDILDADSLSHVQGSKTNQIIIATACYLGTTRLIDNIHFDLNNEPLEHLST